MAVRVSDPRPGAGTRIGITMTPQSGWHAYWQNPGDSGLPPEVTWTLPEGVTISALEHPAPSLLTLGGLASYVHEGRFTLLAHLRVDSSVPSGTPLPVRGALTWLACSDSLCVPERANLAIDLVAGDASSIGKNADLLRRGEAVLPRPAKGQMRVTREQDRWEFRIDPEAGIDRGKVRLYPATEGWFSADARQRVGVSGDQLLISVAASGSAPAGTFKGVLSDGRRAVVVQARTGIDAGTAKAPLPQVKSVGETIAATAPTAPAQTTAEAVSDVRQDEAPSVALALIGALIGGLLLNLMPCVFPILSLKALSLARSGADQRAARIEGIAYVGGSVLATTALGAVLLGARAMGHEIGWSFQLQDPRIILALAILALGIALNLAGLFEVHGPSMSGGWLSRRDWVGAFGTGLLAAVIATPCSGPFMGVALGAALLLPAPAALAIFAGLGLGMALPFLLIAFVPRLQRLLPKPGSWMADLRRILAIPMLLTALGLAWVLGRQVGVTGMVLGLALATLAAIGLWWVGIRQHRGKRVAIALVPVGAAFFATAVIELPAASAAAASTELATETFSEKRYAELRAAGTPVFVDMTADWCLICQVNQRVAIDRPATQQAFRAAGVVTLIGDWTRGDPAITRFLASKGRNSIPYYLYTDASGRTEELPQVLTSDLLVKLVSAEP
ncbi:protein-disulfide reductase DsbD family protein [Sphingomonas jeddahensis]|nr:thioredoxin family protein [Sphingomonas jeddahensis]